MDCCARSTRSCRWKTDVSRNAKSARQTPTPSQPSQSLDAGLINSLKPTVRSAFLNIVRNEQATFLNDYLPFWLREEQVAPAGDWRIWRPGAEKIFPLNLRPVYDGVGPE